MFAKIIQVTTAKRGNMRLLQLSFLNYRIELSISGPRK